MEASLCPANMAIHPFGNSRIKIPDSLLAGLREDFFARRIRSGIARLETHQTIIESLDPTQRNAAPLVGHLAQWVEAGFSNPALIRELLSRFPKDLTTDLSVFDYVHLRLAEALVAMANEEFDQAISRLEIALTLENQVRFGELVAISNYWIGKCHRRMERYDNALRHTAKARELALALGHDKMAAVMKVLESWLIFKRGKPKEATRILGEAETVLLETDDHKTLGNIQSAYGRIARREGRYDDAITHFTAGISEFKRCSTPSRHLARSLTNMAFAKQLIALQLQHKMDLEVARRRKSHGHIAARVTTSKLRERARMEELREEAQKHLAEAEGIYLRANDLRGSGMVHLNRGLVYLDSGELDRASEEASAAYQLGQEKSDNLLLTRARILGATVESAKFEERIEEGGDPDVHAKLASQLAHEAVERAQRTQNRRLLARAFITEGLILSNDFFNDSEATRRCTDRATMLLKNAGHDYLWEYLQVLKDRVHRAGGIDSALREWSRGIVRDKTFQQITEEFAGIVIPKVWKFEGQNISRVVTRLSISPKKVRRILSSKGFLNTRSRKLD
jgi:tetratricopeptide (TPR) repeat protein